MAVPKTSATFAVEYMVMCNYTDEQKAHVLSSSIAATSPGEVNLPGSEEKDAPLDLRYDTAFKAIFSQKIFMIDLLNSILDRAEEITDISYQPTESLPAFVIGKKVIFDLKCTLSTGEIIIVEMQYASQNYFKERALYYVARNIDHQLQKWNDTVSNAKTEEERKEKWTHYRIKPVCGIFITNFSLDAKEERMMRDIWLTDVLDDNRPFTDKMRMIFLELPVLKREEECDTTLKEWLYVIKNSMNMEQIAFTKDKPIFQQLAEKARYAALTPEEQELYDLDRRNEMAYWESIYLAEEKAEAKGLKKGRAEGKAEGEAEERAKALAEKKEIARKQKELGIPVEIIAKTFGFSSEQINNL